MPRVIAGEAGLPLLKPGEYGKDSSGIWMCRPPTKHFEGLAKQQHPMQGSLAEHSVTEHEDGTITVDPSILIQYTYGDPPVKIEWHGYLKWGVWLEV